MGRFLWDRSEGSRHGAAARGRRGGSGSDWWAAPGLVGDEEVVERLQALLGGFQRGEAGKELIDAGGAEEGPDAFGDADDGDLAAFVGLGDVGVDDDAEAGGVHVFEVGAVDDEEVGVDFVEFGLELENVGEGECAFESEHGAAGISGGLEGVVELVHGHPPRIEI